MSLAQGERCTVCFEVEFVDAVEDPVFECVFRNDVMHTIFVPRTDLNGPTGSFAAGEQRRRSASGSRTGSPPSRYTLTPGVLSSDSRVVLERRPDYTALLVGSPRETGGVADLPVDVEVQRP